MADKFITLHPNNNGVLDLTTDIYPNIKASQNILDDSGKPITIQEKLKDNVNIKTIKIGTSIQSLLGTGIISIDFLNLMYPIGTIYTCSVKAAVNKNLNSDPICPIEKLLGGVWEPIYDKFLFAAAKGSHVTDGDYFPGDVGGTKDATLVTHTHEMSRYEHSHVTETTLDLEKDETKTLAGSLDVRDVGNANSPFFSNDKGVFDFVSDGGSGNAYSVQTAGEARTAILKLDVQHRHETESDTHTHTINPVGSEGKDKNMPPYLAVYAWQRIS